MDLRRASMDGKAAAGSARRSMDGGAPLAAAATTRRSVDGGASLAAAGISRRSMDSSSYASSVPMMLGASSMTMLGANAMGGLLPDYPDRLVQRRRRGLAAHALTDRDGAPGWLLPLLPFVPRWERLIGHGAASLRDGTAHQGCGSALAGSSSNEGVWRW
jgi:hypothetical protein